MVYFWSDSKKKSKVLVLGPVPNKCQQTKAGIIFWTDPQIFWEDPQITRLSELIHPSYHENAGWCKYLFYNHKFLSSGLETQD